MGFNRIKNSNKEKRTGEVIDIALKVTLLAFMVVWCLRIINPFLIPIIWGVIIAVAVDPVYQWVYKKVGKRPGLSATFVSLVLVVFILVPTFFLIRSSVKEVKHLVQLQKEGKLEIPDPDEKVLEWPFVGESIYELWKDSQGDITQVFVDYEEEFVKIGKFAFSSIVGTGFGFLKFILSIIIAGILLATPHTRDRINVLFEKAAGSFGQEFVSISEETIKNVVKGILAVAVIQASIFGFGLVVTEVPLAGIWALIVLLVSIVQLPTIILVVPILFYLWAHSEHTGWTVFWSIYFLLAGGVDNILKPILMGQGAPVPMVIVFLGAIGGLLTSGIIGLFVGAIVLSLGYRLLIHWLDKNSDTENEELPKTI